MQKEINKLLKRVSGEKLKNNLKECIELYNIIGGLYSDIGSFDEAIYYHEQAKDACKTIGDRLATAIALRYIGEAKASQGQFYQAIEHIKKYLDLAQKTNNKVEIQRAWTTLGRVYLMQAQDMKEKSNVIDDKTRDVALEAEKRFQTALNLADSVRDQVDEKEFAQMKSGLLINIGLIKDILGQHGESILRINRAVELCRSAKLREDLYRCQIILAGIFRQRNNVKMAVKTSEEALTLAKKIGKKLLICDAYIESGLIKISQRDFKNAKRAFAQAYLEKSPSEEDHFKAIRLTKLAHLISVTYDKLTQDNAPSETRIKLCDKLGDLFVQVNCYKLATEFYKRSFADARICSKPRSELARILYSIAETYADDGQFEHALVCYEKELTYRNGNDNEQCQSLIKIAHMHEYLNHEPEKIGEVYEKALEKADKNPKLMYNVLKYYIPFAKKKSFRISRYQELENVLSNLRSYPEVIEEMDADVEGETDSNDLEDEIENIDDIITDDEDNDEVMMVGRRKARGAKKFKPNEVGDTPLHEACIKGDLKRVKSLIAQGHEVNPRDNAGWIPLHEACNHGHYDIVEYLLESGADVSNRGLRGMSPLHDAATNGHYDIMRILMRNGANVIALTDSGETVLSCLRDYKKRNYSEMSNRDLSEYKAMEAELLNTMDKSGFNLMEANMKNLNSKRSNAPSSSGTALEEVRPRARNLMSGLETNESNPVKDYKMAIVTLKRKRIDDEPKEVNKKTSLPATYHTGSNTSAPTKEWLIDDISRDKRLNNKRALNLRELMEFEDDQFSEEDDDYHVEKAKPPPATRTEPSRKRSSPTPGEKVERRIVLDSDDDDHNDEDLHIDHRSLDNDVLIIEDNCSFRASPELHQESSNNQFDDFATISSPSLAGKSLANSRNSCFASSKGNNFDLFKQPLVVMIEDRKLLVPIKEEYTTIKCLKESIIERYSALVDAKPIISLAPVSDPDCILFDGDLCQDVIRENIVALVNSWQLESIEESYSKNCSKISLNPLDFIRMELKKIGAEGNKLDLSFTRFPKNHIRPIIKALARRDFTVANLTGAYSLFEYHQDGQEMLQTISTWKKLSQLSLRCSGLRRYHFETICCGNGRFRLPDLKLLDVSVNSIAYKCKVEFKGHIESLRQSCPNLKRLDMRKNHLKFVKSICIEAAQANINTTTMAETELDLSRMLDLMPSKSLSELEILGSDQLEYSVY